MDYFNTIISDLMQYSFEHQVNPYVFISLYLISIPIFYSPLFYLRKALKERKNKELVAKYVTRGIIISSLAYIMPLVYVLIFGKNLPSWLIFLIFIIMFINLILIIQKFRKRGKI